MLYRISPTTPTIFIHGEVELSSPRLLNLPTGSSPWRKRSSLGAQVAGEPARLKLEERFLGDRILSSVSSFSASSVGGNLPSNAISFAVSFRWYSLSFASLSGRKVEPSRNAPANKPRDRE